MVIKYMKYDFFFVLAEALACSATLFLAHEFPLNSKYIEPEMIRGGKAIYVWALLYYAAFLTIPIAAFRWIS